MDYAILKTELTTDPLGRGYAAKDNQQVADSLNTVNRTLQEPVPIKQVLRWSVQTDAIYKLKQASASGPRDQRRITEVALVLINHPHITELDVEDPEIAAMLAALVAMALFKQGEVDALKARGQRTVSRAEELVLPPVSAGHIDSVRRRIGV